MIQKLAVCTKKNIDEAKALRSIYCGKFATRGIAFKAANTAFLQYFMKKINRFRVPALETQDTFVKWCSSSIAFVADEGKFFPAALVAADVPKK